MSKIHLHTFVNCGHRIFLFLWLVTAESCNELPSCSVDYAKDLDFYPESGHTFFRAADGHLSVLPHCSARSTWLCQELKNLVNRSFFHFFQDWSFLNPKEANLYILLPLKLAVLQDSLGD